MICVFQPPQIGRTNGNQDWKEKIPIEPVSYTHLDVYKRQDMNMGVAGSLVMDGKVGAHPLVHKVVLHIGPYLSLIHISAGNAVPR